MAKRLRSLASILWDSDLDPAEHDDARNIFEVEPCQKLRKVQDENKRLLEEVARLEKENSVLKIPRPLTTEPSQLHQSRSELLSTWPMQKWISNLRDDVLRLPRLWQEIIPQLHDSRNCSEHILFDLCQSPTAKASTVLSHAEQCIRNLFRKYPAVFKVGITSNPVNRWSHSVYGFALDKREGWLGMKILAVCDTSFSAALVESALIRIFQSSPGCRNDRPGGETPSIDEGPHFAYVVYRILLPPQQVVSSAIKTCN